MGPEKVLITGASSGIGASLYRGLAGEYDVTGVSRRGPDISADALTPHFADDLLEGQEMWDHLILNHGIMPFNEIANEEQILQCNFMSYYRVLQRQQQYGDLVRDGGSIILMASVSGTKGEPDLPFYASLKAGLINLAKSYAQALASNLIRVNSLSPGPFDTNLVEGECPQFILDRTTLGREGLPEEIVPVVRGMLQCHYMTGQNIMVDGGASL